MNHLWYDDGSNKLLYLHFEGPVKVKYFSHTAAIQGRLNGKTCEIRGVRSYILITRGKVGRPPNKETFELVIRPRNRALFMSIETLQYRRLELMPNPLVRGVTSQLYPFEIWGAEVIALSL